MGIVAEPGNGIATHTKTVPLLGGAAMVLGILPALWLAAAIDDRWGDVLLALVPITLLGLYKDRVGDPVPPMFQLLIQCTAAAILVLGGLQLRAFPHEGIDAVVSILVAVWIINAWNFVDVLDGLAGSLATTSALAFAIVAGQVSGGAGEMVAMAIVGSAIGFLLYNRPPARIFMGDIGSFALGLMFAALVLAFADESRSGIAALLFVAVPLADVVFCTASRLMAKRSPLVGRVDHMSLLLLARGWSGGAIVGLAVGAAACLAGIGHLLVAWPIKEPP